MKMKKLSSSISFNDEKCGIYLIMISHHFYVGSSYHIYCRIAEHRKQLRRAVRKNENKGHKKTKENKKFINAYKKYGENNCYWTVLEECDRENLLEREKYWIQLLSPDLNINKDPTIIPLQIGQFNENNSISKPVYQYDLDGNYIAEYPSVKEAGRQNPGINIRSISLVAAKSASFYKSAGKYQWSYEKVDKMPQYVNNSDKAKIKTIFIFDILTGVEEKFNSIADYVRKYFPNCKNFDSLCAAISCSCKRPSIIEGRYIAKYNETDPYIIPKINKSFYYNGKFYINSKEAEKELKMPAKQIRNCCKDESDTSFQFSTVIARIKLCESGKTFVEGNPNPS